MQGSRRVLTLIVALVAVALTATSVVLLAANRADALVAGSLTPTIQSDKADYPPGATVTLTGSNWQPGESVHINVNDEAGKTWSRDVDVSADESGNITDQFDLPNWFVATYKVTVTGAQSGEATTSFTDAAVTLQGQSNPPCSSGSQCDGGYQNGNLTGWKELDQVPFRLKFNSTGHYTVEVTFDHVLTSDSTKTGIQDLYNWAAGSGVTLNSATLTDSTGPVWTYTVDVNVTSIPQPAGFSAVNFKGNLSAGAHNFTGNSMAVGADNGGGNVQIVKPAAAPGSPDLAVTKSGPTSATPGSTITYTLNYQNKSTAANSATGAQLTDILPSGVTYVSGSCSGTCSVAGNEVTWNLGTLATGASGSRTLQVQIPANAAFGATYTDTGRILSAENDANINDNLSNLTTTVSFNRNPVANNDSLTTNEDTAGNVSVLTNDTDPDGDTLTVTGKTNGTHGTVSCTSGGLCSYTPNANFNGTDSFTYTVSDGKGGSATGTVNVTVNPVNDPPVNSVPGAQNINEDQSRVFSTANSNLISVSDIDAGGDDVEVTLSADHGKVSLGSTSGLTFTDGDGTDDATMTFRGTISAVNGALDGLTFAPDANYDGADAKLTMLTNDLGHNGSGSALTDTDSVSFNITSLNDPPVIPENGVTNDGPVDEGSPATITVTATDLDTPSADLRYSFDCNGDGDYTDPEDKGPQAANDAQCIYPDNGTYTVNVKVTDGAGGSDTGSTSVLVNNVNPSATFDATPGTIDEGQSVNPSLTNVVDPGTADTHEYSFKCGDADWTAFGASNTNSCQATDDGNLVVKGQVRDDDGGLSDVYEKTITVNNVPPHVDPPEGGQSGENQSSDEGQNKSFEVGSFTDPGDDGPWSVTIDWGDGSSNTTFNAAGPGSLGQMPHTYDDNGDYTVTVNVAENGANAASDQASFHITVNNVSPTGVLGNDGPVNENANATISFTGQSDSSNADNNAGLRYAYNCDGSAFGTIPTYASLAGSGDSAQCSFADNGDYTVLALIMDKDGGYNVYTTSVDVNNVAPRVTLLSGADLVKESTTAERTYTFNATDAGDDQLTINIDCGANGNLVDTNGADPGGTYQYDPATGDGSFKCIFPDGGPDNSTTSNVTVRATDDDGASDADNQVVIVTVSNDNPQATFNAPDSVNEGDNIDLSLTDATDPAGPNDTLEYRFDCGNGFGDWGASNTRSCPTNDNGNVTVRAQVRDEDGGLSDIYQKVVTVNNVAPKVVLSGPDTVDEGQTREYSFTVTDAGSADSFTIENGYPTCGANGQLVDGSLQTTATGGSFRCLFPDGDSTTNVEIQVRDDDGSLDSDSQRVVIANVANVAPVLTPAADQNSVEGQNESFDLGSFADPGADGPWSVTVDWGDGSSNTTFDSDPGALPQKPHTYADNGTYTVTVTVAEAGGAPSDSGTFIVTVANAAPSISLTGPDTANEGDVKHYDFTVTDAGTDDTHTIARDCGNNGVEVANSFTYDEATRTGSFECRFPDGPAQTNVTVRVTDDDGASDADNQVVTVTVANVAPTVHLTGPDTANEGDTKHYDFTVTDPGNDNQTIDWDCGNNGEKAAGSFTYDPNTGTGSFECRFPDGPANSTVSVSANDGDGTGSDSIIVNVANVAPTANDDQMTTTELKDMTGNLLDNDSDPGNDLDRASLEILDVNNLSTTPAGPLGGVVTISNLLDGNTTYTPNRGFIGADSFRYKVCDEDGDCSQANVQVTVGPVDCSADGVIRGTSGADILRGTPGDDVICAFGGNDRIYAGAGDDILIGAGGWDRMWGEGGSDVMRGGDQTDAMDSGLDDDYISGDAGRDVIMARGGNDVIELRDGSPGDAANGGAGRDQCKKDPGDQIVSCELH